MVFGKRRVEEVSNEDQDDITDIQEDSGEEQIEQSHTQAHPIETSDSKSKPLLNEVISGAAKGKNPGGSKSWTCKHCMGQFTSSYTRIHHHFFGGPPGSKSQIKRCQALLKNRDEYERVRRRVQEAEKSGVSLSLKNSTITKRQKPLPVKSIEDSFNMMEREVVDLKIIKGLCANGIPFNVLRNPHFCEMVTAINRGPKGYKPPSFERARTTLLDECKRSVEKDLVVIKDTWYNQGVSIVSDGWSNVKHKPLINIIAANSRGAMFMYANDFSGIEKTGNAIAQFLLKAIEEVGPSNVLQVVTDNAANCKAAGKEVEKIHKHIFWSPCVVHTLNLVFKDFANTFDWLRDTYIRGKNIVKYFINHTHALSIFRGQSKLELLKVAKTRFASHYILLKRLVDCREALATTIVLRTWKEWVKQGDEHARKMGALVAETIGSEDFWDEVEDIISITKPIYYMIKFSDGEGPKMGEIYERMDSMLGQIKDKMRNNKHAGCYPQIESIVLARWEKMNIPMHCLGFALTPRFYDPRYLETPAPGGIARRAPNVDKEVVMGVMEAFEKIAENAAENKLLREQFATFHMRKGIYAMAAAQLDAVTMDAIDWWSTYGSETPELAEVAKKVLSQPISSSSAERNWSTYSYIHNVKRNRLNGTRADKLVFIHSNIRLQSRFSDNYKEGPYKKWDVDPDNTCLEESSVRLEEMKWASLDKVYDSTEPL
ncbi:uncharacterized protein LOC120004292 [Tripterygium wilfordii]|uniref:uncharacterized protein LOC120004292 n=1 Tax=Tripterygium wilfordii TaxID=458696 RepID=UPI0018F85D3D|nr:uncharacterized protein LOC120004292 [Tripterygium wilfordii]